MVRQCNKENNHLCLAVIAFVLYFKACTIKIPLLSTDTPISVRYYNVFYRLDIQERRENDVKNLTDQGLPPVFAVFLWCCLNPRFSPQLLFSVKMNFGMFELINKIYVFNGAWGWYVRLRRKRSGIPTEVNWACVNNLIKLKLFSQHAVYFTCTSVLFLPSKANSASRIQCVHSACQNDSRQCASRNNLFASDFTVDLSHLYKLTLI